MKTYSDFVIHFGNLLLLGRGNPTERSGIIEGETISLPTQYQTRTENIVNSQHAKLAKGGNRSTSLELTTVQRFDTPQDAHAALVAHECAWMEQPELDTLTISGIGSWQAGITSRAPSIRMHTMLYITYSIACVSFMPEIAN